MLKEAALGAVCDVPGRTLERVEVVEPVLVKLVARLPNLPVQPIVQHLGRHCTSGEPSQCPFQHYIMVTGICEPPRVTEAAVAFASVPHIQAPISQAHSSAAQQLLTIGSVAWVQHGLKIDLVPHISSR